MAKRIASEVDVVVVGAGSAGLAAARTARARGLEVALLEAAHRVGGRAFTDVETLGVPFDLGCHWMHSASLNPYVDIADAHGFAYSTDSWPRRVRLEDRWASRDELAERAAFAERCHQAIAAAAESGRDVAVADVTPRDHRWTPIHDFWISLMTSVDADQASVIDLAGYRDTGENWPLADGYGALVARHFADEPVALNARVERLDWGARGVRAETPKGTVRAAAAIVAVSTGVLAAGDIRFEPQLPDWKLEAVAGLPLGSHNRVGIAFDRDVFGTDERGGFTVYGEEPETIAFQIRPFDRDLAVGLVGGRFSAWLERAGPEAMADYAVATLKDVYGADIARHIVRTTCSAWDGDPLVRGAYSCARPGCGGQRAALAKPVGDRLFFAGEATSTEFFSTCHGAYLTGIAAAEAAAAALAGGRRAGAGSANPTP